MSEGPDAVRMVKKALGEAAAGRILSKTVVGLGSGSTSAEFIRALGERFRDGEVTELRAVATSSQSRLLAGEYGIPLHPLDEFEEIDVVVDGADEVDPAWNLIKGAGGAHTMEKIVAAQARHFLVIVDWRKIVEHLGTHFPVPVEVIPAAYPAVMRAVARLGGQPKLRMATTRKGPVITDLGNLLIDARFSGISEPAKLETRLNSIPGVIDNGLFCGMAHEVLVGEMHDGMPRARRLGALVGWGSDESSAT